MRAAKSAEQLYNSVWYLVFVSESLSSAVLYQKSSLF